MFIGPELQELTNLERQCRIVIGDNSDGENGLRALGELYAGAVLGLQRGRCVALELRARISLGNRILNGGFEVTAKQTVISFASLESELFRFCLQDSLTIAKHCEDINFAGKNAP